MGTSQSTHSNSALKLSWRPSEGTVTALASKNHIRIGSDPACTYGTTVATNEGITTSETSEQGLFEWKILIRNITSKNDLIQEAKVYIGFIDAPPETALFRCGYLGENGFSQKPEHHFGKEFQATGDNMWRKFRAVVLLGYQRY